MIRFDNWKITSSGLLAQQYDNLTRRVEVVGDLPEGWSWELLVQVGDAMDIIPLKAMEGGVGHTLTSEQVSIAGYYTVQLRGRQGEMVRHTNPVQTFVPKSLSGDSKWPTLPSEFSEAEARIAALNAHPPKPGEEGYWLIWNPETDAYETSGVALPEMPSGNYLLVTLSKNEDGNVIPSHGAGEIIDYVRAGGNVYALYGKTMDSSVIGDEYIPLTYYLDADYSRMAVFDRCVGSFGGQQLWNRVIVSGETASELSFNGLDGALLYTYPQTLTDEQQEQARENINAAPKRLIVQADYNEIYDPETGDIIGEEIIVSHTSQQVIEHLVTGGSAALMFGNMIAINAGYIMDGKVIFQAFVGDDVALLVLSGSELTIESVGVEGPQGPAGYTPVKGVDYWTEEDRQSMVDDVLAALPAAEGVGF